MTDDVLIRIRNVAMAYYKGGTFNPTETDFNHWLETLLPNVQRAMRNKGMDDCKGILHFQRVYFEQRGYSMEAYMKTHLNKEQYEYWQQKNQ
jgi:hypothetical protein